MKGLFPSTSNRSNGSLGLGSLGLIVLVALCAGAGPFLTRWGAKRVVVEAGYTDPRITDATYFGAPMRGCWGKGAVVYDFTATDASARTVDVAVCCQIICEVMR